MAGSKIDLEKFTGKNDFNNWKVKMEALLITQGLGDALEPIIKKEGLEASTSSSSLTLQQATEIDKKARSTINLSLGDSVIREVARERTVVDLWAKLERVYITKSLANRLYIKKMMLTLKMAEGSSLEDHIDEFNQVCDTLEIIDETLSLDEVKAALNTRGLQEKSGNMNSGEVLAVKARTDKKNGISREIAQNSRTRKENKMELLLLLRKRGMSQQEYVWLQSMCKKIVGIGNVNLKLHDGTIRELRKVRYVSELKRNLISLGMLDQMGLSIKLESGELRISNGDGVVMKGYKRNGVYVLNGEAITGVSGVSINSSCDNTLLWNLRLGHMSLRGLKELQKQGVLGSSQISELDFYEDCVLGKATRNSFGKSVHSTKGILEYIHSDLWGPAQTISLSGNTYFLSLIDDYSRRVWVYVLKHKDQVFGKFREWKSLVENQTGLKVKKLRTDNGLEFCNQEFDSYCAYHGIARHRTVRLTPQQNGLAERMNRTLMDKVRSMMIQSQLLKGLWAETLLTASYLVNLSPSAALDFKTPFEKWHGKPADYNNLKVFGCPAYAHVSQGKLAPKALKGKFIGYPEGVKGFKLWCTDLNPPKCIISRDVIFNEKAALEMKKPTDTDAQKDKERTKIQFEVEPFTREASEDKDESYQGAVDQETDHVKQTEAQHQEYQLTRDRERRKAKAPVRYGYAYLIAYALTASHQIDDDEPKNYKEAIHGPYKDEWKKAMDEEIDSLKKNNTWELVKRPANSRTVGCKWIYKVKDGLTATEPRRFKARLVAKGYTQRAGVDFKVVFSPIVRHTSIRVLLALTAIKDMELDQLDVKTVFLHGRLNKDILMTQPEGYTSPESADCVRLLRRCSYDVCVYYKIIQSGNYIYLLLYVDDMLIACSEREEIEALKQLLNSEFDIKDLGPAKKILGMEIIRNRNKGTMILSQMKYLEKVLGASEMSSSKSVVTPLASHFKMSCSQCPSTDEERSEMTKVPYANVVGCMMYAMVLTRPDLAHALSVVSMFMATPGKDHWKAVKWVLGYLKGTQEYGLVYGKLARKVVGLCGYVNSDYAGDLDRRRSLTGYMFFLDGCLVNWKASLQHIVALSTTEAEYTAATEAVKEALWLRGLITELGMKQETVEVHCDSSSAIYLSKNPAHHEKLNT
ncbi:Integrase catalytic domain-containing protein [Citrus sinensis]|nr:Integrase catalytic domain-containing protein [Citrus sinensis]